MDWQKLQKFIFILFLLVVIISLFSFQIFSHSFDLDVLKQELRSLGIWSPIVFIILYTIGTIFIPSTPFMAIAGIFFGFKYGLLYTIIGGFLSSTIIFTLSRKLGKKWVEKILQYKYLKHINKYNERLDKGALWDLIILRITPIMPFNVLNIIMGISKIKTGDYILGTLIGLIPSNLAAVYFGDIISKIF